MRGLLDVKPSSSRGFSQRKHFSGDVEQRSPGKRDNFLSQQKTCRPTKRCRNAASNDSPLYADDSPLEVQVDRKGLVNGDTNMPVNHEEDAKMHVPKSLLFAKSRLVISKETEEAVRIASTCKLENPSFMVILRPYNEKHVDLPAEFVKRHLSCCSELIELQVHNGKRKWPVRCHYRSIKDKNGSRTMKKIGRGWPQFCRDNNLRAGDVVFLS